MLEEMLLSRIISQEFYNWLIENGFKKAPASTKYHGAFKGGLYKHSEAVTGELLHLTDRLNLQWQRPESPWIIGMFHDLCKIDSYKPEMEDVIVHGNGEVYHDKAPTGKFVYNEDQILKGHGDKSVMLLSQFMTLTEEEILCIRYHMGAYETENWKQFDMAIKKYPNVLFTHTADMVASKLSV